ncbi:MAG: sugar ABC transporter permease [Chloroflexi bacterium]|nr:sugar ABC transporter permease [Chloroflexota bacterium]
MATLTHVSALARQRAHTRRELRRVLIGLLFVSPWLLGFILWTAYPIIASLYYSFTEYDVLNSPRFIGFANYINLFTTDNLFKLVLGNTVYFVIVGTPAVLATAFLLANLLNRKMRFRSVFRTAFFVPSIVPAVAAAMVWLWMYNPNYGLIDNIVSPLGVPAIPWLSSTRLAKISLILINMWACGSSMLIFLGALQDVPRSLYDAAFVDGANRWQRFWNITIPMTSPAILFVAVTSMIGTFQYFTMPWLLTQGGPDNATNLYSVYLYQNAFQFFKMGYASAMAWILFVIIVIFTILIFRLGGRRVYYAGGA